MAQSIAVDGLRILEADGAYCLARYDRTLIAVWRGACTKASVDAMYAACETLLTDGSAQPTYISILEATAPAPPEAARAVLARWSRNQVPKLARAVIVAEGGGFRAATVRGVGVALSLLLPHRVALKFVGSVGEGADELAPFLRGGRSAELVLAVGQLRHALPANGEIRQAPAP